MRRTLIPGPVAIALAVALGTSTRLEAQPAAGPLTFEAAVTRTIESNRRLIAERLRHAVADRSVGVASERPNPDLAYEAERETPHQAITFSLPIELGGKRGRRIDLARAGVAASDADVDRATADVRTDVRRAYFSLIAAEMRVRLVEDARSLAVRARDTAATRAAAGDVARQEVLQAQLGVFAADQDLSAARGDAAAGRADLNLLMGLPPDSPIQLADLPPVAPLPAAADLLRIASDQNAELVAFDRRIAEQAARRELARSMQTPDMTADAALTYHAMPEFSVGWRAGASVTLPLFTKHTAAVALEDAELTRLKAERDAVASGIGAAVIAALARAAAAREQVTRYETDVLPTARQVEQMVQEGYSAGLTPLVTLLAALQQTHESRMKALQAGLDYQRALADLERAMGTRLR